jgi:hypothetical protein
MPDIILSCLLGRRELKWTLRSSSLEKCRTDSRHAVRDEI